MAYLTLKRQRRPRSGLGDIWNPLSWLGGQASPAGAVAGSIGVMQSAYNKAFDDFAACRRTHPPNKIPKQAVNTQADPCYAQFLAACEAGVTSPSCPSRKSQPKWSFAEDQQAMAAAAAAAAPAWSFEADQRAMAAAAAAVPKKDVYAQVAEAERQRLAAIRSSMNIQRPDGIMPIQVPGGLTNQQQSDTLLALSWQAKQERDSAEAARGLKTAASVGAMALVGIGVLYLILRKK